MSRDNREDLDGLIQDVLDGVATEEQAARLRVRMEQDSEARERYAQAAEVFHALGQLPEEQSPVGLREQVFREVRSEASRREAREARPRWFGREWWRTHSRQAVLSFASGAGVGAAVVALVLGGPRPGGLEDPAGASGALIGSGSGFERGETLNLDLPGAHATVQALRKGETALLRIEGVSDGDAALFVRPAGPAPRVVGLYRPPPGAGDAVLEDGGCRVRWRDTMRCTVLLAAVRAGAGPVQLRLESGGTASGESIRVAP